MSVSNSLQPDSDSEARRVFESLLVAHQTRIYFFIRSMVFNPDDAKDLLQDVNAIVIRKRGKFTPGSDFKSWSFAIARFECLTYLRRHKARPALLDGLAEYLAEGAEARADDMDSWLTALSKCRELLSAESERLLDQRYQSGVPLEEIARRGRTTEGALKQKLFRVRTQLRSCILHRLAGEAREETDL